MHCVYPVGHRVRHTTNASLALSKMLSYQAKVTFLEKTAQLSPAWLWTPIPTLLYSLVLNAQLFKTGPAASHPTLRLPKGRAWAPRLQQRWPHPPPESQPHPRASFILLLERVSDTLLKGPW